MGTARTKYEAIAQEAARIGPNAVLQLEQALLEMCGHGVMERVFARAGLSQLLNDRPSQMIDERLPQALFDSLFAEFPSAEAGRIAHRAGLLTGAYILKHRIPAPVRTLLKWLPAPVARSLLVKAILQHSWTFAGSGTCSANLGRLTTIQIEANPLAMPGCAWHVGVFETLFRSLVGPRTTVAHVSCCLDGAPACRFHIRTAPHSKEATPK